MFEFCAKADLLSCNNLTPLSPPPPKKRLNWTLFVYFILHKRFYRPILWLFTDIDECETDNGNCQEQCNNTLGSYFCECGAGFALQPDERTCGGKAHTQLLSLQTNNHCRKLRANFSQRRTCVFAIICSKNKKKNGKNDGYKRQEYQTSGGRDYDRSSGNDPQQFRTSTTWTITQNRLSLYDKYE